jgi:hypothetical protein
MTDRADPDGDNLGKMGFLRVGDGVVCISPYWRLLSFFSWAGPSDGSLPASGRNCDIHKECWSDGSVGLTLCGTVCAKYCRVE